MRRCTQLWSCLMIVMMMVFYRLLDQPSNVMSVLELTAFILYDLWEIIFSLLLLLLHCLSVEIENKHTTADSEIKIYIRNNYTKYFPWHCMQKSFARQLVSPKQHCVLYSIVYNAFYIIFQFNFHSNHHDISQRRV